MATVSRPSAARRSPRLRWVLTLVTALLAGGLVNPGSAAAAVGVPVTYVDHSYGTAVTPSADKPQSKLWHHGGTWWALMVGAGTSSVSIHELVNHQWVNTGTLVDNRAGSTGDALWSTQDSRLYVASRVTGASLQVNAFTFASGAWTKVAGFPVTINSGGGSESATIDQDSMGRLWVTYTRAARLWVAHSELDRTTWTAGFEPPGVDTVINGDDLSALIAFGGRIGVMWSDQDSGAFRFAIHEDGAPDGEWTVENALVGPGLVDDHINLKQLTGDSSGRIFAAVKTAAGDLSTDPPGATLVGVLARTPGADGTGSWSLAPAGTVADDHTRPILMIDSTNQELYFFATANGEIVYKKSSLSGVSFPAGRGTAFVDKSGGAVNNASGAKDSVTAASGMVILANAEGLKRYVHAEMELAGGSSGPGDTTAPTVTGRTPASGATGVAMTGSVTATFSEPVEGVSDSTVRLTTGGSSVSAAVTLDGTGRVATLDPAVNLAAGATYTATLTGAADAIRDLAGNPLESTSWTFTTASGTITGAPTVRTRTPAVDAAGVGPATNVTATFSEVVQGVTTGTFTLVNSATGGKVTAAVTRNGTTNQWILDPAVNLAADAQYTATLTGGSTAIRDTGGTPLTTVSWSFLTGPAPTVKAKVPAANATGISRTGNVMATFSEAVQNVTGTTFFLKDAATGALVTAAGRQDGTTNRWILDPAVTLTAGRKYTVTVVGKATGVTDLAGNPLKANVVWSFTTGAV